MSNYDYKVLRPGSAPDPAGQSIADAISQAASWQAYAERLEGEIRKASHDPTCPLFGRTGDTKLQYVVAGHPPRANGPPIVCECWKVSPALSSPRPFPSKLLEVVRAVSEYLEVHRSHPGKSGPAWKAMANAVDALSPEEREAIMGGDDES